LARGDTRRRHRARDLLLGGVGRLLAALPLDLTVAIGAFLGTVAYRVLGRDRRRALEHVAMAFPGLPAATRVRYAREAFRNAGRSFAELAQWEYVRRCIDEHVMFEGIEHVETALALRRGVLAVTGHVGNWELLAAVFAARGYPLAVVARRVNGEPFDDLISRFRARAGVGVIQRDDPGALRQIVGALRAGSIVALLADQDTRGPGVFVPFFGRPAHTSPGAAIIALRTHAPVVAVFIERRGHGHHVRIEPVYGFDPAPGRRPSVEELTARMTAAIEEQIRRSPGEWVWWHRRWRRKPPPDPPYEC
jgi:KDO2-lipid IV(A) lauroyltransferase